jgi:hypothetical protein
MHNFHTKTRYAYPANPQGKSVTKVPAGGFCLDCPYANWNPNKKKQEAGFCALLNVGDWMPGERAFALLWDGIKICHIRRNEDPPKLRFVHRPRSDARPGGWQTIYCRDAAWRPSRGRRPGWKRRMIGPFET